MNEDIKRRSRPPKSHLHEDHHFRTSDDVAAAVATPVVTESDQADTSDVAPATNSVSAEPIYGGSGTGHTATITVKDGVVEAIVENPIVPLAEIESVSQEDMPIVADATEIKESPIEEKIHQLVDNTSLNGWHPIDTKIVLEMPPRNGMGVKLAENSNDKGILALWKKTRKFANATHRWQESGKWIDFHSGMDINFIPKYWKERF